jgi:uncharacterized membrane protein YheB (UPF0754 family)
MDQRTWVEMIFTVVVATLAGGMTDTVSIFLLFRPHEPKGIGRFRIQGALPKNKARLAKSIAKTVGERLLTPEDLTARLNTPALRETFATAIGRMVDELLDRERGSLRSHFTPAVAQAVERGVRSVAPQLARRLGEWLQSPEGREELIRWLGRLRDEVADRPLTKGLTPERREKLREQAAQLVTQATESVELERTLRGFVAAQAEQLATDERPLVDRLPAGFVGAIEHAISEYIPIALERLGGLLGDPVARERVEQALRQAFDHSVRDLLIHERFLAKLVVTDRTIERLVDGFEREGFDRFAAALTAPEMRERTARAVRDAALSFLAVPTAERMRRLGPQRRDAAAEAIGDWLVRLSREPATRQTALALADRALEALDRRTWGDVFAAVPPERIAEAAAKALAGARGQAAVAEALIALADRLLTEPLGRPGDWVGNEVGASLREGIVDAAWRWVQTQIPWVVQQIKVEQIIEQKVNELPIDRVEKLIRDVSQRELDLIVKVGYVLGGLFGLGAFWLGKLVGL